MKKLYILLLFFFIIYNIGAQTPSDGDYRTSTGASVTLNWSDPNSWEVRNNGTWATAVEPPSPTSNVYIQGECIVAVDIANADCKNLNINYVDFIGEHGGKVSIGSNTLRVSGKLRCYIGTIVTGAADGNFYSQTPSNLLIAHCISSSTSGKLSIVGNTRKITETSEWGPYTYDLTCEINLSSSTDTAYIGTYMKASYWKITSGIFNAYNNYLYVENGLVGDSGSITVENGATLILGTRPLYFSNSPSKITFNVKQGGLLKILHTSPTIDAKHIILEGTVEYPLEFGMTPQGGNTDGSQMLLECINPNGRINTYHDLVLSGAGIKTLWKNPRDTTTITGKLSLQGRATLSLGGSHLSYDPGAALEYKGADTQTVATNPSEWPVVLGPDNVVINNDSSVIFNAAGGRTINNRLTLNAGKLYIKNNDILLANSSPAGPGDAITNYSSDSYIVTDSTGSLKRVVASNGIYNFPVGNRSDIQECKITFTSNLAGPDTLAARFVDSVGGTNGLPILESESIDKTSIHGFWEVNSSSPIMDDYTGTFVAKNIPDIIDYSKLHLLKRANRSADWTLNGNHVATTGSNVLATLQRTNMSGFSQFGIGGPLISLPVSLISFNGKRQGEKNILHWTTTNEINNKGFEILRSTNGINFSVIGFINSLSGISNSAQLDYTFTDLNATERCYYRLRMVDKNGGSKWSTILFVEGKNITQLQIDGIYPNPILSVANIVIKSPITETQKLLFCDIAGKIVQQQTIKIESGINNISLNVKSLQKGFYILRLMGDNNEIATATFIKQ